MTKAQDNFVSDDSMALTVRKGEEGFKAKNLGDIYEKHAKLVFLFDDSSSMQTLLSSIYIDHYDWNEKDYFTKKSKLETLSLEAALAFQQCTGTPAEFWEIRFGFKASILARAVNPADGIVNVEEMQRLIVETGDPGEFNLNIDWKNHKDRPPSRTDVVKKLAAQEIEKRLEKFPDALIAVVRFTGRGELLSNNGSKADILACIQQLLGNGGNTDILEAIRTGLSACQAKPSPIGVHHFIVVSDGEDGRANREIADWVPVLKASGVILDYIHIGDRTHNEGLKKACEDLGGSFVSVTTEKDFSEKFVEVVGRKCLPAAQ